MQQKKKGLIKLEDGYLQVHTAAVPAMKSIVGLSVTFGERLSERCVCTYVPTKKHTLTCGHPATRQPLIMKCPFANVAMSTWLWGKKPLFGSGAVSKLSYVGKLFLKGQSLPAHQTQRLFC